VDLSTELEGLENKYKKKIVPLLRDMFERFYSFREHWSNAINCISEIDALCSLTTCSMGSSMVRPIVHPFDEYPFIKI
jgi:DNA mismatch repair ATPase MutS